MSSGDFFDGLKKFLNWENNNVDNEKNKSDNNQQYSSSSASQSNSDGTEDEEDDEDEDDDMPAGTTLLLKIPAKQLKPGGLRLFLMFYLLGMQNTPGTNSWKANQPVSEEETKTNGVYVLEMYFHDATGMIQIELMSESESSGSSEVRVYRYGSLPSTAYLMQESVIVDGILDELAQCAFDESIAQEHRLLIPEPTTAIEDAREALA
ncbi:MAG: hypothetical protein SGARI_007423, partial [Bacillariaceae sp.]